MILPFVTMWLTYIAAKPTLERFYKVGFISYTTSVTQFRKIVNTIGWYYQSFINLFGFANQVDFCLCNQKTPSFLILFAASLQSSSWSLRKSFQASSISDSCDVCPTSLRPVGCPKYALFAAQSSPILST